MLEASRLAQICAEMKNYRLEILGLSETRWNGNGELAVVSGETLLYSGKDMNEAHESGVGILITKTAKKSLIDWSPINDRIITARFFSKIRKITVVQCYSPTEVADVEEKQAFYDTLEVTLRKIPKGDIVILMGDLNAKVGADNTGLEHTMGRNGLGQMNQNGELFADTCSNFKLVIGGTIFPHKDIHKATWVSPDSRTTNQIDHIAISRKWRRSLLDVRSYRGADVASDHYLVVGRVQLKVAAAPKQPNRFIRKRFNVGRLKDPEILNQFKSQAEIKIQEINGSTDPPSSSWKIATDIVLQAADDHLGRGTKHRKPWLSENTWRIIEQRKGVKNRQITTQSEEERARLREEYRSLNQQVKRSARRDKRRNIDELAKMAQTAAEKHNSRELYRITKQLAKKDHAHEGRMLKDENGQRLISAREQLGRWRRHFCEAFSGQQNDSLEDDGNQNENQRTQLLRIDDRPPSEAEIKHSIMQIKNGKSAGSDNIAPELLKAMPATVAKILQPIIRTVWNSEKIPDEWKEGLIVKLPKKGDLELCCNWRGITLQNIINKLISQIILNRMTPALEPKIRREQAGFRPLRSCIDQINTLRVIIEQSIEWRSPLFLMFIDFERAFDSIDHKAIWKVLRERGVPTKVVNIIAELYSRTSCRVIHRGMLSEKVPVESGVKQGCPLSPLLFNLVLDSVMRKTDNPAGGITWGLQGRLEDLDYADDICLLSHRFCDMEEKLGRLVEEAARVGLKINVRKTKSMRVFTNNVNQFSLERMQIEEVESFQYLGSVITTTGGTEADVTARIRKARASFALLNNIWTSNQYSIKTKLRLFNSNVKSVLLYGCETWKVTRDIERRLQVFINKSLRRILRVYWPETIPNEQLWARTGQEKVNIQIKRRKWNWIGHTLRRPEDNIARLALDWNPQGSRAKGRPKITWRRSIKKEIEEHGRTWREIKAMARNRVRFRQFVEALCSMRE